MRRGGEHSSLGKVSYLGGHRHSTDVPIAANPDSQGTRLFLNALFEADCVTTAGQPAIAVTWAGPTFIAADGLPTDATYTVSYGNTGMAAALGAQLTVTLPADSRSAARARVARPLAARSPSSSSSTNTVWVASDFGGAALGALPSPGPGPTTMSMAGR